MPKGGSSFSPKEDFQAAAVEKTRTVDIIDFVKSQEIDDRFFETPYYLVPDPKNFNFPPATNLRKPELDMAKALVNNLASEWDPAKYTDQYRENLLRIIQGKVKGKKVELEATTEPPRAEVDLMERLRRSVADCKLQIANRSTFLIC